MEGCTDNLSQIHMLVEDELEGQGAERLSEHLDTCQECASQFEDFREMKILGEEALAIELGAVDVTDAVRTRIVKLEKKQRRSESLVRRVGIPLAAAATIILLVIAYSIWRPDKIEPGSVAARVTHVSVGGATWKPTETEVVLKMTKVLTDAAERRALRLESGVIVLLNEQTVLNVQGADSLELLSGDIYVDTAGRRADPAKGKGVLLRVKTDHATTIVTGTRFGVSAGEEETSVVVEEGTVTVQSDWGEQEVADGNIFRVVESVKPEPPEPADVERTFSWVKERKHVAEMIADLHAEDLKETTPISTAADSSRIEFDRKETQLAKEDIEATIHHPTKPPSIPQASPGKDHFKTGEEILMELSQPVGFQFECESLRDLLEFVTSITGIDFRVDENIFEQFGEYEDCYGNAVSQKEIFITAHVSELPLETTLYAMLRQHNLGYSIEDDHIYIFARSGSVEWTPQTLSVADQAKAKGEVLRKLSQPVAFEFECEPLRDVIRFLQTITGVNILTNEAVFTDFGSYQDCYGNAIDRKELFVTIHVSEIPLETALYGMLRQHDLAYSVEPGYIYIDTQGNVPESRTQGLSFEAQAKAKQEVLLELSRRVTFEFECEPLRDVLRFLTTTTGINILIDERIFEAFGTYEDCFGSAGRRKDLQISYHCHDIELETALDEMLRQHDLKYSIEPGYIDITSQRELPERSARAASAGKRPKSGNEIHRALQEPVAFAFDCEPLLNALRHLTNESGVNIYASREIFNQFGTEADCYGNTLERKEIFVTYPASQLTLENALDAILEPHGLGFSVEKKRLSILEIEEVKKLEAGVDPRIIRLEKAVQQTGETGWPTIEIIGIEPEGSMALMRINDGQGSLAVLAGDRFGPFEVAEIGRKKDCITVVKHGSGNGIGAREFCREWPEIEVKSILDPTRGREVKSVFDTPHGGELVATLEINGRQISLKTGERVGGYKILSIDGTTDCVTLANDQGEEREFCKE